MISDAVGMIEPAHFRRDLVLSLKTKRLLSLAVVLAVAAMIFFFSAQKAEDSSKLSGEVTDFVLSLVVPGYRDMTPAERAPYLVNWSLTVRKCAHFSEYALLAVSLVCFLHYLLRKGTPWQILALAWLFATLYACTDELHQTFVDGRGPALLDVAIDSAGALTGALLATLAVGVKYKNQKLDAAE